MEEIWKDIPEYEGLYQVSNLSRIRSLDRTVRHSDGLTKNIKGQILNPILHGTGYFVVSLLRESKRKQRKVHRLMAQAFLPNPENKPHINHKNGIRSDNRMENIEWCTHSENMIHKYRVMKYKPNNRKMTTDQVKEIKKELENYKKGDVTRLAKKFSTHTTTICNIRLNRYYVND